MPIARRCAAGIVVLAVMLGLAVQARAQALKHLPADSVVVFKLNNPEAVSEKLGAMAQKLGLANLDPALADPLSAVKKQFNLQQGFDQKGEVAVAMLMPPDGEDEPRFMALFPVSDYQAFLKNFANVKAEGELSSFTMPGEEEPIFSANWGNFAAISPWKDLLAKKPEGIEVAGLPARQLQDNHFVVYVNAKYLGAKFLPQFQQMRPAILAQMEAELGADKNFNQKFTPVMKSLVDRFFAFAELALKEGQAATFGLTLTNEGINMTAVGDFVADGYMVKAMGALKSGNAPLVAGLPNRKYFAWGGVAMDPQAMASLVEDMVAPVRAELAKVEEAKPFMPMFDTARTMVEAMDSMAFGYVVPEGQPGQVSMLQQVAVTTGNARKIAELNRQYLQGSGELMKSLMGTGNANMAVTMNVQPNAKQVDGVSMDTFSMQFKMDPNDPAAAQAQMMMNMMYGPNGMSGFMGAVDERTYLAVVGGDEQLLTQSVASAKSKDAGLMGAAHIQAVSGQLPPQRGAVMFLALDNVIAEVVKFAGMMGAQIPLRLPPDLPPVGMSIGTEGSSVRVDAHISTTLIENLVSAGIQMQMMMQQQRQRPPQGGL